MKQRILNYYDSILRIWGLERKRRIPRVARYVLRGMRQPIAATHWSSIIRNRPELSLWFSHNPRLLLKPSRPYISRDYTFPERVEVIANHYSQINELLSISTIIALATKHSIPLAEIGGKENRGYAIILRRTDKFDREGELVLKLKNNAQNRAVFFLVFSLNKVKGVPCVEIGCLQGPRDDDARELIKLATKECDGIRPKNLLVDALFTLTKIWNIPVLFGVSNSFRIFNAQATFADYDAFWSEIGGVMSRNGMFRLPSTLPHHDLSQVSSHHRSEYRRRMALREGMTKQIVISANAL